MIQLIFGKNSRAARNYVQQIQRKLEEEHGEQLAIERTDGKELESAQQLRQRIESGSLFHTEKLVIIRDLAKSKQAAEWVADSFGDLNSGSATILVVEGDIDKRSKLYKTAKKEKSIKEFEELSASDAAKFAVDYAKEHKGSLSRNDAELLVSRVGIDQGVLMNELDKLLLYNPEVSQENILKLTDQAPSDSIFALMDAITQGRANAAINLYRDLRTRQMHPLEILGTLGWQMFTLVQIKAHEREPQNVIAKSAKLHPFVVGKNLALVKRLSRKQLTLAITTVTDLEEQLKTSDIDPDHSFETMLLKLVEQLKR